MKSNSQLSASFRDPSGFLFRQDGVLYRQVNLRYQPDYDFLMSSGLYDKLVRGKSLIPHTEVDLTPPEPTLAYKVIQPEKVDFISYPYEWSFGQLKDAALTTLQIQKQAIEFGMTLKDASAYNIQFFNGRPLLIDTLSFAKYQEGQPWDAYKQFCQHFLAPLALMAYTDVRLDQLLRIYIDGVPLDLAAKLLPFKTRFNFSILSHIYLHANAQKRYADKAVQRQSVSQKMSKLSFLGLIDNLQSCIRGLTWQPAGTEWADYYDATNYSQQAFEEKLKLVASYLDKIQPKMVWDLGANNGRFSRLASEKGIPTVSFDIDPSAVEQNYRQVKKSREACILPLVMDLTNPSPSLGWENQERMSLLERGPADVVFALALIHHLAISNNVPLPRLADFLSKIAKWAVIEFVPKEDSQVQRLLASREDIFPNYSSTGFEEAFADQYVIHEAIPIAGSHRTLYLLERRELIP